MPDEPKLPDLLEVATAAAVAGATAGVVLTALPAAGLAAIPALVGGTAKLAVQAYGRHQQRKAERWFQLVADLWEVGSAEEATKVIDENIGEPWAHEAVVEGVRGILNGIDDVALPALAKVVARRLKSRTPPDRRDKRAIQLLCDLEPESFEALHQVIAFAKDLGGQSTLNVKVSAYKGREEEVLHPLPMPDGSGPYWPVAHPAWPRAFFLLRKHEFGREGTGTAGPFAGGTNPEVVSTTLAEMQYLAAVLL